MADVEARSFEAGRVSLLQTPRGLVQVQDADKIQTVLRADQVCMARLSKNTFDPGISKCDVKTLQQRLIISQICFAETTLFSSKISLCCSVCKHRTASSDRDLKTRRHYVAKPSVDSFFGDKT